MKVVCGKLVYAALTP
ncbi:hypothetical protein K6U29_07170 [Vibrio parahaemolyticus]|nr:MULTISPECIES: hypothetical protein [Gammaproteobacteria]MCG6442205.1 hypothetical protein [Vibrio parahaemolyticus]MCG6455564.1 hypothetical protein [Vibrio parahaemolyticus]